jgi:hypothetical protein
VEDPFHEQTCAFPARRQPARWPQRRWSRPHHRGRSLDSGHLRFLLFSTDVADFTEVTIPQFNLTGLTIGRSCLLQVFVAGSRTCCSARTQNFGGVQVIHGEGTLVEGAFVADSTQQSWTTAGVQATIVNGYQIRDLTLPTNGGEIPERSTFALLGGSLALLLPRRR